MDGKGPKFEQGQKIRGLSMLVTHLQCGGWTYLQGRPKHPSVLFNMSLSTLQKFINGGRLYVAQLRKEPR